MNNLTTINVTEDIVYNPNITSIQMTEEQAMIFVGGEIYSRSNPDLIFNYSQVTLDLG